MIRGFADLRGTAARAARKRTVARPLRRAARRQAKFVHIQPLVELRQGHALEARGLHTTVAALAGAVPTPTLSPRTSTALTAAITASDIVLVARVLKSVDQLSPMFAVVLGTGIGISLTMLGKRLGTSIASSDRIDDQSVRPALLASLVLSLLLIASLGLTLLRTGSVLAWPLLTLAVPAGSISITWLAYSPPHSELHRATKRLVRLERRSTRAARQAARLSTTGTQFRNLGHTRFRSIVGRAVQRAILDGSLRPDDLASHGRILDQLCAHHLTPLDPPVAASAIVADANIVPIHDHRIPA